MDSVPKERLWISEAKCSICKTSVGHGTFRERKLHCEVCSHAICSGCSDPQQVIQGKSTVCKKCAGVEVTSKNPTALQSVRRGWMSKIGEESEFQESLRSDMVDFGGISEVPVASRLEDTQLTDEVLASAKRLLEEAHIYGRANSLQFQDHVFRYSQRLKSLHSEMSIIREQEARALEELKHKKEELTDMSLHMSALRKINEELREKIRKMDERIGDDRPGTCWRWCGVQCAVM